MNHLTIRAIENGFTANYYVANPKYVAPTSDAKPEVYTPKALHKTRAFATTADLIEFITAHSAVMTAAVDANDQTFLDY